MKGEYIIKVYLVKAVYNKNCLSKNFEILEFILMRE